MFENVKLRKVSKVEFARKAKTYDIEVDSEEHAFVARNASGAVGVSHNSALISLSNLSDERMRNAKSGKWWEEHPEFALANNSVAYTEKPEIGAFMREWQSLYDSKSGERGIFNRFAALKKIKSLGRRDAAKCEESLLGVNPCCFTGDMKLLTDQGYKQFSELVGKDVNIVNIDGKITVGSVWSSGVRPIVELTTSHKKKIRVTADHIFLANGKDEIEAAELKGHHLTPFGVEFDATTAPEVLSVKDAGMEEVFDFTEPETHWGVVEGVVAHNSEIFLRSCGFCNLSTSVVRPEDTLETLTRKVETAVIIGTFQSTLTNFRYLRNIWKKNAEEERLLGVSFVGIMDHPVLSGKQGKDIMESWLDTLKNHAIQVNKEYAEKLGINQSVAITCVKPEGCTSLDTKIKTSDGHSLSMQEIFERHGYDSDFLHNQKDGTWLELNDEAMFVLDENDDPQKITKLYVNGVKEVFSIVFEDGNSYKFTGNHKLKTSHGWKRVDELTDKDEIISF